VTTIPTEIERLLRIHLGSGDHQAEGEIMHRRRGNRGGLLRLPLVAGGALVVKVWPVQNLKEQIKASMHISNARREWRMHRLIHRAGLLVPEPRGFLRVSTPDGRHFEVMAFEDLGETERGLPYLKRMISEGDALAVAEFEARIIDVTAELINLRVLDIDHQLNNFVVDGHGRLFRIDFECAQRTRFMGMRQDTYMQMLARLLASHVYAVQPHVERTEQFGMQLYSRLQPDKRLRSLIQSSVDMKLEVQRLRNGVASTVSLPS